MPSTFELWRACSAVPFGNRLFSAAVAVRAPYFRTVLPTVTEMRSGRSAVRAPLWWGVHNHIKTFHAIAACNLAEVAMGMLAEATVPATHRWLPRGMRVEYLAKASTGLHALAELDEVPEFGDAADIDVPVHVYDKSGTEVVRATITVYVTRKPGQ